MAETADRARRFLDRLREAGGEGAVVDGREEVRARVLDALGAGPAVWDGDSRLDFLALDGRGVPRAPAEPVEPLLSAALGITAADLGLAETGTIQVSGAALLASLLPSRHLAVLSRTDIVDSLEEFLERGRARGGRRSWVTGPSRTADIEKVLTIGVHGPEGLTVLVY